MKLISPAFNNNDNIPVEYTCDGENINPPLHILDIPKNTVSIALIMDDPDAPMGTFTHWVLWNINPEIDYIAADSVPLNASVGINSAGNTGYTGPCPPSGVHHYHFKVYALDSKLDEINSGESREKVEFAINNHTLDTAELIGLYQR